MRFEKYKMFIRIKIEKIAFLRFVLLSLYRFGTTLKRAREKREMKSKLMTPLNMKIAAPIVFKITGIKKMKKEKMARK